MFNWDYMSLVIWTWKPSSSLQTTTSTNLFFYKYHRTFHEQRRIRLTFTPNFVAKYILHECFQNWFDSPEMICRNTRVGWYRRHRCPTLVRWLVRINGGNSSRLSRRRHETWYQSREGMTSLCPTLVCTWNTTRAPIDKWTMTSPLENKFFY